MSCCGRKNNEIGRGMLLFQLKSKIHRGKVTASNVDYEGSIEISADLLEEVGIIHGEKVLIVSITTGERLETYAQPGKSGSGVILVNGGAARKIGVGERVTIMAFAGSEKKITARKIILNEKNEVISN